MAPGASGVAKAKVAVGAGGEVVAAVVLEDHAAGQTRQAAADRVGGRRRGHAGDRDVGDVGRADGARGLATAQVCPVGLVLTVTL